MKYLVIVLLVALFAVASRNDVSSQIEHMQNACEVSSNSNDCQASIRQVTANGKFEVLEKNGIYWAESK